MYVHACIYYTFYTVRNEVCSQQDMVETALNPCFKAHFRTSTPNTRTSENRLCFNGNMWGKGLTTEPRVSGMARLRTSWCRPWPRGFWQQAMDFKEPTWGYPQIIHFHDIFHYKPSILGYPHLWNGISVKNHVGISSSRPLASVV